MIILDVFQDVIDEVGFSDEAKILRLISKGVERSMIAGQWDGKCVSMDICVGDDLCVALPPEIEVPLGLNVCGQPARFRNVWFEYNLNGPGTECGQALDWVWDDKQDSPTIQPIVNPSQIVAYVQVQDDANSVIRVWGTDENDLPLRQLSVAKPLTYKTLTTAFVQPSYATPIQITISLVDDNLVVNAELAIENATTETINYYRIQSVDSSTLLTIVQSSTDNDPTGTNFTTASVLMQREWEEGILIPTIFNFAMPDPTSPLVKTVTRIWHQNTKGYINLIARDTGRTNGTLLSVLYPNINEPKYRKIKLPQRCTWVRMRASLRIPKFSSLYDFIPLDSQLGLVYMCKSIYLFSQSNWDEAKKWEDQALLLLNETQMSRNVPETLQVQYNGAIGLNDEGNMW